MYVLDVHCWYTLRRLRKGYERSIAHPQVSACCASATLQFQGHARAAEDDNTRIANQISDVFVLDQTVAIPSTAEVTVHHQMGSSAARTDYLPLRDALLYCSHCWRKPPRVQASWPPSSTGPMPSILSLHTSRASTSRGSFGCAYAKYKKPFAPPNDYWRPRACLWSCWTSTPRHHRPPKQLLSPFPSQLGLAYRV